MILVILAARFLLLNRLPKRTFVILWGMVLLRLLLPFSFSSMFSVYSLLEEVRAERAATEQVRTSGNYGEYAAPEGLEIPKDRSVQAAVQYLVSGEGIPPREESAQNFPVRIVRIVWCLGALLCMAFFAGMYLRAIRNFRTALPVELPFVRRWLQGRKLWRPISVRQSDQILAPLTYGIFRPVILLPKNPAWKEAREFEYVLQHEYVHICHLDSAWKLVMTAALCLHWFNPLVWVMSGRLGRDIELACDEGVLRQFGENARDNYALTLIGMEEKKCGGACFYNGFSKNAVEERIKSIMKYRKMTLVTLMTAVLLVSSVAVVFATSAQGTAGEEIQKESEESGMVREYTRGELTDPPKDGTVRIYMPIGSDADSTAHTVTGTDTSAGSSAINSSGMQTEKEFVLKNGREEEQIGNAADGAVRLTDGGYKLSFWIEGMLEEEAADLYAGAGYCILIPSEGWQKCAPDAWQSEENPLVWLWVIDFGAQGREEVAESLVKAGYVWEEGGGHNPGGTEEAGGSSGEDGNYKLRRKTENCIYTVELRRQIVAGGTENTWGIYCAFPAEAEEGFGARMYGIASNFGLFVVKSGEELSKDQKAAAQLMTSFWQAYLSGDTEAVKQYLTADYSDSVECFPDGTDGYAAADVRMYAMKGLEMGEMKIGDRCAASIEFSPSPTADYLMYLTVELVKEQDGWKVCWYGLEQ